MTELEREHARLMLVREQIAALERASAASPASEAAAQRGENKCLLQRLRGLGAAFSGTLANEVFYKDFSNQRRSGAMSDWRPVRGAAAGPIASRGSARRAIRAPAR